MLVFAFTACQSLNYIKEKNETIQLVVKGNDNNSLLYGAYVFTITPLLEFTHSPLINILYDFFNIFSLNLPRLKSQGSKIFKNL